MPKIPFMKFYPSDFLADTQMLTMQEAGMWIKLLCHIWVTSKNGTIQLDSTQLSAIIGTREDDLKAFRHLMDSEVGDIEELPQNDSKPVQFVIHSRRIHRDKKRLKLNALYVSKHRSKGNVRDKKLEARSQKLENTETKKPVFSIPDDLVGDQSAILDWLEYKRQKGQSYKPKGLEAFWKRFRAIAKESRRESVDHSMANGWSGLFEKNGGFNNGQQRSHQAAHHHIGETERADSKFAKHIHTIRVGGSEEGKD